LEFRQRWRSLAILLILVALSGATVMAAAAGARRQASVVTRFQAVTLPANAAVLANIPGFDWSAVRRFPEVAALTTFGQSYPIEGLPSSVEADLTFDRETFHSIERPVIYGGRLADPSRADEATVTRGFVTRYGKSVGDSVVVVLSTPAELQAEEGSGPDGAFTGPRLRIRIVGVVEAPWYSDQPEHVGGLFLSPGVVEHFTANTLGPPPNPHRTASLNALVRLRHGSSDLPQFRQDLTRLGFPQVEVLNLDDSQTGPRQQQATFNARCLLGFAIAAMLAALFLVGQSVARYIAGGTSDVKTLRGLGATPGQGAWLAAAGPVAVSLLAVPLAVIGALVASRWFPIGAARLTEPNPGVSADWVVLGIGLAAIIALVSVGALASARTQHKRHARTTLERRSTVATAAMRSGMPLAAVVGLRFALEPGRGDKTVPVRPAMLGAVAGVLGLVAAFTFSHAVDDAGQHPERFGQTFQQFAFTGANDQTFVPIARVIAALDADADVTGVDDARVSVATSAGGKGSVTVYSYTGGAKPLDVVLTSGRMPTSMNEIVLAPRTRDITHTSIGSEITLTGTRGTHALTVTGIGFVPRGFHNRYVDGAWMTDSGYDQMFTGLKFRLTYVSLRPQARTAAAGAKLSAALASSDPKLASLGFQPPEPLAELLQIREVRALPKALGLFLAILAIGAIAHALVVAVRVRGRDIAVLRVLGMTPWQCRWVVATHAATLAIVGVLLGVPLGIALGRTAWRLVATSTPLQYVAPTAPTVLILIAPIALIVATVLAAIPGHRAARLSVAHVLRSG
jgi:hypothetical protein